MKRRVLSLLLALVLLVSAFPVSAQAEETEEKGKVTFVEIPTASSDAAQELPKAAVHSTASSAGAAIRSALKNRQSNIEFYYRVAVSSTNAQLQALVDSIMEAAFTHNGKSNEGDYLRFHTYANPYWKVNGSYYPGDTYLDAKFTLEVEYSSTASQESAVTSQVSSLISSLNPTGTNYQKLKTVYDWMCNNIRVNGYVEDSAYNAIVNREAGQAGFATLLYRLCLEMGLKGRIIRSADGAYLWNISNTGNLFYNMYPWHDVQTGTRNKFLVSNATLGYTRASAYNTSSFNSSYKMGSYDYNPYTAATIVTQPKSVSVANGKTAKVTVVASGEGLTYQWYVKNPGGSSYSKSSVTGSSYSCPMDSSRNGRKVYCKITDRFGNSVTSSVATLSMSRTALKITSQPVSVTVAKGATAKVTVKAVGDGLTYRWYYKDAGASSYTYTSSFKGNTYSVEMTAARNGRRVLCKVYDKYGNMVQSDSALLKMKQTVKITSQPQSVTVAKGATAKVTVKATGDGLTYRWYYKDAGSSEYVYTSSFKGNTYSVTMTAARNGRRVLCRVYDKYGNSVKSNSALLKMK